MRNTDVDYGMRFVVISDKDEVLRISHAGMSELFDRKLALPQYAGKRIRWCEVAVSLKEGRAVAVQRFLSRYIHFDAHGVLDLDRQLEEARLRMDVSSADTSRIQHNVVIRRPHPAEIESDPIRHRQDGTDAHMSA